MRFVDVIRKKRDGEALSEEEIEAFVSAYTAGEIPDYQASAFLMACFLRGLNDEETSALTDAMMHSGEVIEWKLPHTVAPGGGGARRVPGDRAHRRRMRREGCHDERQRIGTYRRYAR